MKKKILSLVLVFALALTAIGGTLAYFTDTDSAVNTMTSAHIDITLVEQERAYDTQGNVTDLKEYTDEKVLYPITDPSAQGEKDAYGMPVSENYSDKIVRIKNELTSSEAYVRAYYAIPVELDNVGNAGKNVLHVNQGNKFDPTGSKTTENANTQHADWKETWGPETLIAENVEIDGAEYNVYAFTYLKPLASGNTTQYAAIVGCYLDKGVDYDAKEGYYTIGGEKIDYDLTNIKLPVYAIGTQTAGFTSADEALDAAFGANFNPWAK